jgi:hypothetical protein
MAPPPQTAPHRSKGTGRCALMSLFSTPEESSSDAPSRRQSRRFFFISGGNI